MRCLRLFPIIFSKEIAKKRLQEVTLAYSKNTCTWPQVQSYYQAAF